MNEKTARALLEKVRSDYDAIAYDFSKSRDYFWHEFDQFLPFISDKVFCAESNHKAVRTKILDLGCGNGRLYGFLSHSFQNKFEYTGIDNSKAIIQEANKRYGRGGVHIFSPEGIRRSKMVRRPHKPRFIVSDMLSLPFPDESFDIVFSLASFHHIPSRAFRIKALKEIHRVLKPDSTCILLTWNLWRKKYFMRFLRSFFQFVVTFGKYDPNDLFIPWQGRIFRYYHAFTFWGLQKMVRENGFKVLKSFRGRNFILIMKKI